MNKTLAAILSATVLSLVGCAADAPDVDDDAQSQVKSEETLTGRYRFVFNEARRQVIYADLAKELSGEELEKARREVDAEAGASVVEFTKDSRFRSLIGEQVLIDAVCEIKSLGDGKFLVESAEKKINVRLEDGDLLVMDDPRKGELTFERIQ